jgi:DNA polymerase elongation subunit (family B)
MKHSSIRPTIRKAPDSSLQYTYCTTLGSRVYIRARDAEGAPHVVNLKYTPTYYLPTTEYTGEATLDGEPLLPHQCSNTREGRGFLKSHPEAYGNIQCEYMALADTYGDTEIVPDMNRLYIWNLDIETAADKAFAPPDDPFNAVTAITVKWRHRGESGTVVYSTKPYTPAEGITYQQRDNEHDMLVQFLKDWRSKGDYPDIVTGWNIQFFDIPYLVNRMRRVINEEDVLLMSPFKTITHRMVNIFNRDQAVVDIRGVAILDYLELYRKFTYSQRESYRLDHIAHVELDKRKLSYTEYQSLDQLYRENFQKFLDYNILDVELVDELDQKLKLIELVCALAYSAKANYVDTFKQVRLWDIMIYHNLRAKHIQIPPRRDVEKTAQYAGGYVKAPHVGQHEWIASFDVASMYPHIIRQWNLSPETLVAKVDTNWPTVDDLLLEPNSIKSYQQGDQVPNGYALAANGVLTQRDHEGFLPAMLKTLYDERMRFKKKLGAAKRRRQKLNTTDPQYAVLTKQMAAYNNQQMVRKVNLNSAYGALGSQYFRFYDTHLAEAVTLTGQLTIRWVARDVNAYLNTALKTDADYVIASDTDSVYVNLGALVKHTDTFNGKTKDQIVTMLDKFCEQRIQTVIDASLARLASYLNVAVPCLSMTREVIADKGVWTAKKRYMLNVYDTEGVRHTTPRLKMMGIEAVKSSTPSMARMVLTRAIELLLRGTQEEIWTLIQEKREEFMQAPFQDIAMPRSVNGLDKYSDVEKGVPIHVAGTLAFNRKVVADKLTHIEQIREGSKIRFAYLRQPNVFRCHVLAAAYGCPVEWQVEKYVDYEKQFQIVIIDPLNAILNLVGWSAEHQATLFD